jgi:hypothetical protein
MAAPKGNRFWELRAKHGRDKLFQTPELLLEAAYEYFQWCEDHPWYKNEAIKSGLNPGKIIKIPTAVPFTITGLLIYVGASSAYWRQFKLENHQDFSTVIETIEHIIYNQKFTGASVGIFNANIISRDLGLADKREFAGSINITNEDINFE